MGGDQTWFLRGAIRQEAAGTTTVDKTDPTTGVATATGAGDKVKLGRVDWDGGASGSWFVENFDGTVVYSSGVVQATGPPGYKDILREVNGGARLRVVTAGNVTLTYFSADVEDGLA